MSVIAFAFAQLCLAGTPDNRPGTVPHVETTSRFLRLANALQRERNSIRVDFVATTLSEMAIAYSIEADVALQQVGADPALGRWVQAVTAYSADLAIMANRLTRTTPVQIAVLQGRQVQLRLFGRVILVDGPRIQQTSSLEYLIVEQFCSQYHCNRLLAGFKSSPTTHLPVNSEPTWSFGDASGPSCKTTSGLALQFDSMSGLREKKMFCRQLIDEINALVEAIERQRQQGVVVNWASLRIAGRVPQRGHRILLNRHQDTVVMPVPTLYAHPSLLKQLRPWMAARAKGKRFALTIPHADALM